jgi:hypothetical protein
VGLLRDRIDQIEPFVARLARRVHPIPGSRHPIGWLQRRSAARHKSGGNSWTTIADYDGDLKLTLDLIKLDLEGGELPALRGATETMTRFRPSSIIEIAAALFEAAGHSLPRGWVVAWGSLPRHRVAGGRRRRSERPTTPSIERRMSETPRHAVIRRRRKKQKPSRETKRKRYPSGLGWSRLNPVVF